MGAVSICLGLLLIRSYLVVEFGFSLEKVLLNRTNKIAAVSEQICPRPLILPHFFHIQFPLSAWTRPFSLFLFLWRIFD